MSESSPWHPGPYWRNKETEMSTAVASSIAGEIERGGRAILTNRSDLLQILRQVDFAQCKVTIRKYRHQFEIKGRIE